MSRSTASALAASPVSGPGRTPEWSRIPVALLVLCGALFALWRVTVLGLAEHHVASGRSAQALQWLPDHPRALENEAAALIEAGGDREAALALLRRAIAQNPARGTTHGLVGAIQVEQGDLEAAERSLDKAVRLKPAGVDLRLAAAALALQRGELLTALQHWDVALSRRGSLRQTLFPTLLEYLAVAEHRSAFAALARTGRLSWWPAFVAHAAAKAKRLETVAALYDLSYESEHNRLSGHALGAVLRRLQQDGFWLDSRLAWMDSLPDEQLDGMGNVFNGGFEYPISDVGFDWIRARAGHILVESAPTFGMTGNAALHVLFRGPRVQFRHLSQWLMLAPGDYLLKGRVRVDGLEAEPGVMWTIACLGKRETRIGQSAHFKGRGPWRGFEAGFAVPEADCPAQVLRLQLDGRVALDFEAKGSIWFDDLAVVPGKGMQN